MNSASGAEDEAVNPEGEPESSLFVEPPDDPDPEPYSDAAALNEREIFTTPIDPDVQTLLSQIEDKSLILKPDFQRGRVWDRPRQSRLIESLLLNIPIPPCFFAEDADGVRVVVDGQQRLRAIDEFRKGQYPLTGLQVRGDLNKKAWDDLESRDARKIVRRVIRTIVITHHSDPGIRFEIFQRLNTGGVPLTEQEIRNAIYRGNLNTLLDKLARTKDLLAALNRTEPDKRLRHHELVLRYFALRAAVPNFKPPLKRILNDFMRLNRNLDAEGLTNLEQQFGRALEASRLVFGEHVFRRYRADDKGKLAYESVVSKAVYDLQMIGLGEIPLESLQSRASEIRISFEKLSAENTEFVEALSRATDHRSRFYLRMRLWAEVLRSLDLNPVFAELLPAADA